MGWATLCDLSELEESKGKYVDIDGFELAVFLHDNQVHVLDNTCPHAGGNLSAGFVEGACAVCPWHFWAFDLKNGQLRDTPGVTITVYPTRLITHDGREMVQVNLPKY